MALNLNIGFRIEAQNVRLSFKVILDETTGLRPSYATENYFDNAVEFMNNVMSNYGRSITFSREATVTIGGIGTSISNSFSDLIPSAAAAASLESAAMADVNSYAWRQNRINIYFNGAGGGGWCSFPESDEVILIGNATSTADGSRILHEIGHFFNLCHTQGCSCGSCGTGTGTCTTIPGDDGLDDTLPDLSCWTRDEMSNNSYGSNYSALTESQKENVDNTFNNVMSYHRPRNRFTEDQLDRWVLAIFQFDNRQDVVDTKPIYINANNICSVTSVPCNLCTGSPQFEYDRYSSCGFNEISSQRRLMVFRPGVYDEQDGFIFDKECLLVGSGNSSAILK